MRFTNVVAMAAVAAVALCLLSTSSPSSLRRGAPMSGINRISQPGMHMRSSNGLAGLNSIGKIGVSMPCDSRRGTGDLIMVAAEAGLVQSLGKALSKSRNAMQQQFNLLMTGEVDDDTIDELEEQLLMADVGISTTTVLLDPIRDLVAKGETDAERLRGVLRDNMRNILNEVHVPLTPATDDIWVILVVGVNGAGKTTTIAKLANRLQNDGRKIMLAAGDTFRAAAVDQLGVWADRLGVDMTRPRDDKCKPSTVVYDAIEAAKKGGHDTVIIDTAGRLQNKEGLMDELNKIYKAVQKSVPNGPHETLLVLDGTVGQNSVIQAKEFNQVAPLSGVVVTKLDGSSKGGAIFSIAQDLKLPVRLIGVGEKMEDLRDFSPDEFIEALA